MKVYIYKMHAGYVCTDQTFTIVDDRSLSNTDEEDMASDYANSYGNEQDEDGEWEEGDPGIYLVAACTTKAEVLEHAGDLCYGNDKPADLIKSLEEEGMVWA